MAITLLQIEDVLARRGIKRGKLYQDIRDGLWTPPVKVGRSSFWPDYECARQNAALVQSATKEQRMTLVNELLAVRRSSANAIIQAAGDQDEDHLDEHATGRYPAAAISRKASQ